MANLANSIQQYNLQKLTSSQGSSSDILAGLTGLANTQNAYATGQINPFTGTGTALDTSTQAGTYGAALPFTPDELNALHTGAGNVLQPDVTALQQKLGNTEEADLYATRNGGVIPPPQFTPGELTALGQGATAAIAAGNSADWNSATAKIFEAQKQGLDAQRLGYMQSMYNGGSGTVDPSTLVPPTSPLAPSTFAGMGPGASAAQPGGIVGAPAGYDAKGNPLDAMGNPWNAQYAAQYANGALQDKLENQFQTNLKQIDTSSKGPMGVQSSKVNQAISLQTLINQIDQKGGTPSQAQFNELAIGTAALIASGTSGTDSERAGLMQKSLAGDVNGIINYFSGGTGGATTQQIYQLMKDSIAREGTAAQDRLNSYIANQANPPTGLDPNRVIHDIQGIAGLPNFTSMLKNSTTSTSGNTSGGPSQSNVSGNNWFSSYLGGSVQ